MLGKLTIYIMGRGVQCVVHPRLPGSRHGVLPCPIFQVHIRPDFQAETQAFGRELVRERYHPNTIGPVTP